MAFSKDKERSDEIRKLDKQRKEELNGISTEDAIEKSS
jgi:hypothetical protein